MVTKESKRGKTCTIHKYLKYQAIWKFNTISDKIMSVALLAKLIQTGQYQRKTLTKCPVEQKKFFKRNKRKFRKQNI